MSRRCVDIINIKCIFIWIISFLFVFCGQYICPVSHVLFRPLTGPYVLGPCVGRPGAKETNVFYCLPTVLNFPEAEAKNIVCGGSKHRLWQPAGPSLSAQSAGF